MSTLAKSTDAAPSRVRAFFTRLDAWLEVVGDKCNPILVKETRQTLKSRQFSIAFLLMLAACWIGTMGGMAWVGPGIRFLPSGGFMFTLYYVALAFALLVVVPFAAYRSLAAEQESNTRDTLMVSSLTPEQLVRGKLGSAALQAIIFTAVLAPCLAFTYLLRGIDVITILIVPTITLAASLLLSIIGIALASASERRYTQVIVSVAFVTGLLLTFWFAYTIQQEIIRAGSREYQAAAFWWGVAAIANIAIAAFALIYQAAVALNSFSSANRSTGIRWTLLAIHASYIGWIGALAKYESDGFVEIGWIYGMAFWVAAGAFLCGEGPITSERVRRTLPEKPLARGFLTWLNPGSGTGYFFTVANLLTMSLLMLAFTYWKFATTLPMSIFWTDVLPIMVVINAYILLYLGIGRLAVMGLRKVARMTLLGGFLIQFLLVLTGIGLPELVRASFDTYARSPYMWLDITSPTRTIDLMQNRGITESVAAQTAAIVVVGAALCVMLVNAVLTAREIRLTRAPLPQRVIEDDAELHATPLMVANPWGDLKPKE